MGENTIPLGATPTSCRTGFVNAQSRHRWATVSSSSLQIGQSASSLSLRDFRLPREGIHIFISYFSIDLFESCWEF
ncbi:hypothetical protein V6Z12_A06G127300 [Gossypium hirsutum]